MEASDVTKVSADRVMGIDASTKSVAFCLYEGGKPIEWGTYGINGADIYDRMLDTSLKAEAILDRFEVDYVAIEAAVFVNSPDVAVKLAYVYSATMISLLRSGVKVIAVTPLQWQNHIGNGSFKKAEKEALKAEFPGKSASWYSNKTRQIRKQRTLDFFASKYGVGVTDDNVGDAFGLAEFATSRLTRGSDVQE
jgi:Holliday junction resolvasome RuvABC endonuclease subunit